MLSFSCFTGVEYVLQTKEQNGKGCTEVCKAASMECQATGHGFTDDNTVGIFNEKGVECKSGESMYDPYEFPDEPSYSSEQETDAMLKGRCVGWKGIPKTINCDEPNLKKTMMRLCPCA